MWENKEELKKKTEEYFTKTPIARMKHFDSYFAVASFVDGKYKLVKDGTKAGDLVVLILLRNYLMQVGQLIKQGKTYTKCLNIKNF